MKIKTNKIFMLAFIWAGFANAENQCIDVLNASKTTSHDVSSKSTVTNSLDNFCNESASSNSSEHAAKLKVDYETLVTTVGVKAEYSLKNVQIARDKYCGSSQSNSASDDAYDNYLESVDPQAFSAYNECLKMNAAGVGIKVVDIAKISTEITFTIEHSSSVHKARSANMSYLITNNNVGKDTKAPSCKWLDQTTKTTNTFEVKPNTTTHLKCTRPLLSNGIKGTKYTPSVVIQITRLDKSGIGEGLAFHWQATDNDGFKLTDIAKNKIALAKNTAELASLKNQVNGQVGFRVKISNNGTVSCDNYCAGDRWADFSGACIGAKMNSSGISKACDYIPPGLQDMSCLCAVF